MATVIGYDDSGKKRCTCQACTAIVEYKPNEVQRRDGYDYSGGPDGEEYIRCPDCKQKIVLRSW